MQPNGQYRALNVTGGRAWPAMPARSCAARPPARGLTAGLSAALRKKGTSPLLDRGIVLTSLAAAIALGVTSMSDIAVLAHLAPSEPVRTRAHGATARARTQTANRHQARNWVAAQSVTTPQKS